jgi:hypothetical protein
MAFGGETHCARVLPRPARSIAACRRYDRSVRSGHSRLRPRQRLRPHGSFFPDEVGVGLHWKYTPKLSAGAGKVKESARTPSRFQTPVAIQSVAIASRPATTDKQRTEDPIPSSSLSLLAETDQKGETYDVGDVAP